MNNPKTSLFRKKHPIARPEHQLSILRSGSCTRIPSFREKLQTSGAYPLKRWQTTILQVNVGKMCNQTCGHCHVDAGPDRKEVMSLETMEECLRAMERHPFQLLDLTGGAPEMNPGFNYFVERARPLVGRIMVRSNLTILVAHPKYEHLPEFFRKHSVEVVSSLPCYSEKNTDNQRGKGVFRASLEALKILNSIGYGSPGSGLSLHLVYNPGGPYLPGDPSELEASYRRELYDSYGIQFNDLLTITNMPISRFLESLVRNGQLDEYLQLLHDRFNPRTIDGLMCRNTLSVGWDGRLFDCDFNQMLELGISGIPHIRHFNSSQLEDSIIATDRHCYGCTAGRGSGCSGAIQHS